MSAADEPNGRRRLLQAAAELVAVAEEIEAVSVRTTAALTRELRPRALLRAAPRFRPQRRLLRALTRRAGLGIAFSGGPLGRPISRMSGLAGPGRLAVHVLVLSLRLRIAAVERAHPELTRDPVLQRLVTAISEDRDVAAARALRALFRDRGAQDALSAIAPMFGEILALRALLDENPFNDAVGWAMATGRGVMNTDPITGITTRVMSAMDRGAGVARPTEATPEEAVSLRTGDSIVAVLRNIQVVGTTGRMLIQSVLGPDETIRYVVQAPGMRPGGPRNDSPQDLVGAFRNTVLRSSPYTGALKDAIEQFGVPEQAEIALIGHSAGGSAVMNLAQDPEFCGRYRVTHVIAAGSPIDFKVPADSRTWIASITNQHDLIPVLDGQGSGSCFDLHPTWYTVDYADATHRFPLCHSVAQYAANLADDLPEARAHIDAQLTPYHGSLIRSQLYLLLDHTNPREPR
ncbi:hypothetical protein Aph01nite_75230 [Acrocarpospora phusangensis]|uniref:Fungal lipase-like domain-containing protein n=1 Tax=Acrocarpospora phusangensis TaxID=1070424 RepID=A0A919QI40_9ACTN|nr:hypothetical protein [Acrocarpospora phusangensis]GIH29213.1 hypothetical protein Aph01nite_75230 [Acrocarpospora phusangensis]